MAVSDSLFGRTIEVALTCDQVQTVTAAESCLQFQLNFTNGRYGLIFVIGMMSRRMVNSDVGMYFYSGSRPQI